MIDISTTTTIITAALTAIFGVIATLLPLYFKLKTSLSNLGVDIAKNAAEKNVIAVLGDERDKALAERDKSISDRDRIISRLQQVDREKSELYGNVQSLSTTVDSLNSQISFLKELIEANGKKLDLNQEQMKEYIAEKAILQARLESEGRFSHRRETDSTRFIHKRKSDLDNMPQSGELLIGKMDGR